MKSWRTSFIALLLAETLAMIGFGLSMPIIPLFLEEDIGITDPVQLRMWVGLIQSASAITLAIFAPIWGHLADVFSRRAMLLRAMFGGAAIISLMAFATTPSSRAKRGLLLVGGPFLFCPAPTLSQPTYKQYYKRANHACHQINKKVHFCHLLNARQNDCPNSNSPCI